VKKEWKDHQVMGYFTEYLKGKKRRKVQNKESLERKQLEIRLEERSARQDMKNLNFFE
jgi:hypothetical protein